MNKTLKIGDKVKIINLNSSWLGEEGFIKGITSSSFDTYNSTDEVKSINPKIYISLGGINNDKQISSWSPDWKIEDLEKINNFTEEWKEEIYNKINFKELI